MFAGEYRLESRKVGDNIVREIYTKGEHSPYCQVQEEGWVCDSLCTIEDMAAANHLIVDIDELIEVHEDTWREVGWIRFFRVRWKMTRVSLRRRFTDGRSIEKNEDYVVDTWYEGHALTRWGARRKMKKYV